MKTIALAIFLAGTLTAGAAAAHDLSYAHSHVMGTKHAHPNAPVVSKPIHIDCYRGPWKETIWDHPQGAFIDDLVSFGYDFANAQAIATTLCKDESLVDNPDGIKAALLSMIAENPPGHSR